MRHDGNENGPAIDAAAQGKAQDAAAPRILAAARRLFAQKGFRGATTRAIAAEAGVNEVTLFRTWGSKERLLYEVLSSSFPSEASAPLARLLDRDVADAPGLEALLVDFARAFEEEILAGLEDLLLIALKEAGDRPEFRDFLVGRRASVEALLAERLAGMEKEGIVRPESAGPAAGLLVGYLLGRFMAGDGSRASEAGRDAAARFVAGGLRPR